MTQPITDRERADALWEMVCTLWRHRRHDNPRGTAWHLLPKWLAITIEDRRERCRVEGEFFGGNAGLLDWGWGRPGSAVYWTMERGCWKEGRSPWGLTSAWMGATIDRLTR